MAQHLHFPGSAPSLSLTAHVGKINLNGLVASKTRIGTQTIKGERYEPRLLEIYAQALATRSLGKKWQAGAGYGFQRNNPFRNDWRNEHRLVQQVMLSIPGARMRFTNRFRFEERWFSYPDASTRFASRARYLAGISMPIRKEIYWQVNNEVFAITGGPRFSFIAENWLYSGIGFPVSGLGHVETGIGYNSNVRNREKEWMSLVLLQINWSFVIPPAKKKEMHPVLHSRHF